MKKILVFVFVLCMSLAVYSQHKNELNARAVLESKGEIYFSFKANQSEMSNFSKILSVDSFDGKRVLAYANEQQFDKFLLLGRDFELVDSYYQTKALTMAITVSEMSNWDRYPTYDVYIEMMQSFAINYPAICSLDTIGYSSDGRLLLVVTISDNVEQNEAEPEFLYTGMMHGDELIGGMVLLRLIDHILQNYGTDDQITNIVDNVQIYINPFANPDGTYYGGDNTVADSRRSNADDIDLNRNYRDFIAGDHPDGNDYAIETNEFMNFAAERNFVMSANTHSGAELLNYPYDTDPTYPADNDWWVLVSREYADNAQENSPAGYLTDEDNGITNGYDWYTATGTRQDYMNYYHNCKEVTLELSLTKKLDAEDLPEYWSYNEQALLNYLEQVTYGLRGIVTDSITEDPLEAMVYMDYFDFFNSHVYSFPLHGDYYRLLYEGTYHITYSCEGYGSKTFTVDINNYEQTILDVQLVNLNDMPPFVNFISNIQDADCTPVIQFINTSEASESTTYLWDFGDGTDSNEESPSHYYTENGTYTVKLYGENEHGVDSLWAMFYIDINLNELENISDYAICEASGSVEIDPGLEGEVNWFSNILDEDAFYTGATFTTPELSENTTYYIQETILGEEYNGSELNNSEGGSYITGSNDYLLFDCSTECILENVKVYAESEGTRTIYLKSSLGDILYNEDFYIEAGEQIVDLNFVLPVENGLRLGCANPNGLYRGSTGVLSTFSYPYNIGDIITINESSLVWWNDETRYYAYFYNWNVSMPDCYSERTPVSVYLNEMPDAEFEYSAVGSNVQFTNNSTASETFVWDFDDETSSTDISPMHVYAESGTYTVSLTADSDCGNDVITHEIFVIAEISDSDISGIEIYPNPVKDILEISSQDVLESVVISDLSGRIVFESSSNMPSKNKLNVDLSDCNSGVYLIKIKTQNDTKITKIIKN
jgi:PKD repeat protein